VARALVLLGSRDVVRAAPKMDADFAEGDKVARLLVCPPQGLWEANQLKLLEGIGVLCVKSWVARGWIGKDPCAVRGECRQIVDVHLDPGCRSELREIVNNKLLEKDGFRRPALDRRREECAPRHKRDY